MLNLISFFFFYRLFDKTYKEEDIFLCERGNPAAIKEKILELKNNPKLSKYVKENAYKLYERYCTIDAIGNTLIKCLNQFIKIAE